VDAFEQFVRGGLARAGVEVDDTDLAIMRYIDTVFGPELNALLAADMHGLWPEADLDPSRAPRA
jgi:hypothetical protein